MPFVHAGLLFSLLFFFQTISLATDEEKPLLNATINSHLEPDALPTVHKGRLFTTHMIGTAVSSIGWLPLSTGINANNPLLQTMGALMITGGNGLRIVIDGTTKTALQRHPLFVKTVLWNGIFDVSLTPSYLTQLGFAMTSFTLIKYLGTTASVLGLDDVLQIAGTLFGTSAMLLVDAFVTKKHHNKLIKYYLPQHT